MSEERYSPLVVEAGQPDPVRDVARAVDEDTAQQPLTEPQPRRSLAVRASGLLLAGVVLAIFGAGAASRGLSSASQQGPRASRDLVSGIVTEDEDKEIDDELADDPECKACSEEYDEVSGVIVNPAGLSGALTFEDVQNSLSQTCPEKCRKRKQAKKKDTLKHEGMHGSSKKGLCHTTTSGELCHDLVVWTMKKVMADPKFYPEITDKSTFKDVQAALHKDRPGICEQPCARGKDHEFKAVIEGLTREREGRKSKDDKKKCHTAQPGEDCYTNIIWIMSKGLEAHPRWFLGLNLASSFEEIQESLHGNENATVDCPKPCPETCHTAIEGEPCYEGVTWAMHTGIKQHPSWFRGLTMDSSFEEIQANLHDNPNATVNCPRPCNICHTAQEGERCYSAVIWVMKTGLHKTPHSYKGLNLYSSFEEVQNHLHTNKSEANASCPEPCARK